MKLLFFFIFFVNLRSLALALTVDVDKYESGQQAFSKLTSTGNVIYLDKCTRGKLNQYVWQFWEGNYGIRSFIQPVAHITVKREPEELFNMDPSTFIVKALEEAAGVGGNILCYVRYKKDISGMGLESMTFRAYRQFFQSGHPGYVTYYSEESTKNLPLTLKDVKE